MELRQAEYLLAVVDHGGHTAAAEALYVTQPAVSFSLSELRDELGEDIFVPGSRPARLTAFGRQVAVVARKLVDEAESARAAVRVPSTLTIAVDAAILDDPVAGWLRSFNEAFPDVQLKVVDPGSRESSLAWLAGYRCEAAVVAGPPFRTSHVVHPVDQQELALVAAPGVDLPTASTVGVEDLGSVPLILPPLMSWTRAAILGAFERAGIVPRVAVECDPHEAIWPLVQHGAGAAMVRPRLTAEARRRGLQVRRVAPPIVEGVQIVHRAGRPSPALGGLLVAAGATGLTQGSNRSGRPTRGTPEPDR